MEDRFVYVEKRDSYYSWVQDKWFPYPIEYYIKDTKGEFPKMHFLNKEDMLTVYTLLKSKHMVFSKEECDE